MQYSPNPPEKLLAKLSAKSGALDKSVMRDAASLERAVDNLKSMDDVRTFLKKLCKYIIVNLE